MNWGMGVLAAAVIFAIYIASAIQYSGAVTAADNLAWIAGLGVLGLAVGLAGKALL